MRTLKGIGLAFVIGGLATWCVFCITVRLAIDALVPANRRVKPCVNGSWRSVPIS